MTNAATATGSGVTITKGNIVAGIVPVKTLGLPDDYAIDGWGRRILYTVDSNFTTPGAFSNIAVNDSASRIKINSAYGVVKNSSAAYALISAGKNGHGAYPRSGGTTRFKNYISGDVSELANCSCQTDGTTDLLTANYVQKPISIGAFDDLVYPLTHS